jgi:hypothetical protein
VSELELHLAGEIDYYLRMRMFVYLCMCMNVCMCVYVYMCMNVCELELLFFSSTPRFCFGLGFRIYGISFRVYLSLA